MNSESTVSRAFRWIDGEGNVVFDCYTVHRI